MNVSEMLDLMATLGIGEATAVDYSEDVFLQYLNLANCELYSETASLNSDILLYEIQSNVAGQNTIEVEENPFLLAKVLPQAQPNQLKIMSVLNYSTYVFLNPSATGSPIICTRQKKVISFYPSQDGTVYNFGVWYVPQPAVLTANTLEDDIPYPISYQQVLVDGALYYLFQDEAGFRSPQKENEALRRWKTGKTNLISYLRGANFNRMSTFCNV